MATAASDFTGRQKIALFIAVLFGPILTEIHWQYASLGVLSTFSPIEIAIVAALGGAIAGFLFASRPATRTIAVISGAIAGFGSSYAFHLVYGDEPKASAARIFVYALGALPGLILGMIGVYLTRKSGAEPPVAAPQ